MSYPLFPDPRDMVEQRTGRYSYPLSETYFPATTDIKPDPSSSSMRLTSSLTGAVDELHVSSPPGNPPAHPSKMRSLYSPRSQSSWDSQSDVVAWPGPFTPDRTPPMYQRQSPETPPDLTYSHPSVQGTSSSPYPTRPVDSTTPPLFPPLQTERTTQGLPMISCSSGSNQTYYHSPQDTLEEEVRALRREKKDLELMNERNRVRINELERDLARGPTTFSTRRSDDSLIPPAVKNAHNSSSVQASLKARSDARIQLLCSSNRAGNALCSWHDSRRERRTYPPRMAPPGYLNCGCTFEEALFEESLSRHSVGSYRPGETVRMDPALRRPLLRLLQRRYNYRDGDFERDPETGEWVQGEGHVLWEQKLLSSASSTRKTRKEDRC